MDDTPLVLVVEDDPALRELLLQALPTLGYRPRAAGSLSEAIDALSEPFDAVLTDVNLVDGSGLELCRRVREQDSGLPVVVMTGFGSMQLAVDALRAGAWDFLVKPVDLDLAQAALARAVAHRRLQTEVRRLRRRVRDLFRIEGLIGDSEPMRALARLLDRVADVASNVLIVGESGTGKEVVARALHERSVRRERPFVAINCAAVPESLLESELFGHARGAFTDARTARAGLFVQADGGTLLLDEIGDMPLPLQAKLLRVLQERRVRPVGSDVEVPIDVRLIAATHRDLEAAAEAERFRTDLLYRLDVLRVEVPPLRERGNDVLLLAQSFVQALSARLDKPVQSFTPEVAARLLSYAWPGNVRELQNCIERAVVLAEHDQIQLGDLPPKVRDAPTPKPGTSLPGVAASGPLPTLAEVEKRYILQVVDAMGGHRSRAAEVLQIDRKTLYRKLDRWAREG